MPHAPGTLIRFTLKVARRGDYVRGDSVDFDHDDDRVAVYEADPAWAKGQVIRGHGPGTPRAVAVPPHAEKLRADLEGALERQALAVENAAPAVREAYAREVFGRGSFLVELIRKALGDRYLPDLRRGVDELAADLFEAGEPDPVAPVGTDPGDLGQGEPLPPAEPDPKAPVAPVAPAPADLGGDTAPPVERKPLPADGPVADLVKLLDGGAVPAKGATMAALEEAGFQVLPSYRRLTVAELADKARELIAAAYIVPAVGTDPGDLGQGETLEGNADPADLGGDTPPNPGTDPAT